VGESVQYSIKKGRAVPVKDLASSLELL